MGERTDCHYCGSPVPGGTAADFCGRCARTLFVSGIPAQAAFEPGARLEAVGLDRIPPTTRMPPQFNGYTDAER